MMSGSQSSGIGIDGVMMERGSPIQVGNRDRYTDLKQTAQSASRFESANATWSDDEAATEKALFDAQYETIAQLYAEDAVGTTAQGRQVLRIFSRFSNIAEAFTKAVLHNTESIADSLDANLNSDPQGGSQATVRALQVDSFSGVSSYSNVPSSTGQFDVLNGETATAGEQAYLVFGYLDYFAGGEVGYDKIQESVDDSLGTRRPLFTKTATETEGSIAVVDRMDRGPVTIYPGQSLDVALNVVEPNIKTGIHPIGIEVVTGQASEFGGPLD